MNQSTDKLASCLETADIVCMGGLSTLSMEIALQDIDEVIIETGNQHITHWVASLKDSNYILMEGIRHNGEWIKCFLVAKADNYEEVFKIAKELYDDLQDRIYEEIEPNSIDRFFDIHNPDHLLAYHECMTRGEWPDGFLPKDVVIPDRWWKDISIHIVSVHLEFVAYHLKAVRHYYRY